MTRQVPLHSLITFFFCFPDLVEKPVSWTHRCLPLPSISKPFMRVSYPRRLMLLSIEAREPFDLCWLLGALRTR